MEENRIGATSAAAAGDAAVSPRKKFGQIWPKSWANFPSPMALYGY